MCNLEKMGNLLCWIQGDYTVAIQERFGKFEEVLEAGWHAIAYVGSLEASLLGLISIENRGLPSCIKNCVHFSYFSNKLAILHQFLSYDIQIKHRSDTEV